MLELCLIFSKIPVFSVYLLWFCQLLFYFLKIDDFIINGL